MYRHAGIDLSLHPDWHGRGLGADAVRTIARWLFEDAATTGSRSTRRGQHGAIRCYERVGFRPVGIMRRVRARPRRDVA